MLFRVKVFSLQVSCQFLSPFRGALLEMGQKEIAIQIEVDNFTIQKVSVVREGICWPHEMWPQIRFSFYWKVCTHFIQSIAFHLLIIIEYYD